MADKHHASGAAWIECTHHVATRGAEVPEATSTSDKRRKEGISAADDVMSSIPDIPKQEDRSMLSDAQQEFCSDLAKAIREEGATLIKERSAAKQTSRSAREENDKERKRVEKKVGKFLEDAETLANTRTHLKLLFITLHKACVLATYKLSALEGFRVLQASGIILYDFLRRLDFYTPPSVYVCEMHLKAIQVFRRYAAILESADPVKSAKVTARFYLCTSAYQHRAKWYQNSQVNAELAKKLLQTHLKGRYTQMTLYGNICFHFARHFFTLNQHELLDASLKRSFDAFLRRSYGRTPRFTCISFLYSLPLDVFKYNALMLTASFMKHIDRNLTERSKSPITPSEKVLNSATRIWISHLLGNSITGKFKREQKAFMSSRLVTPPPELVEVMTDVLLMLVKCQLLSKKVELKHKFFRFVKDLCLLNNNLYIKFKLLHDLVLAVLKFEDYSKRTDFYLELCSCFTSEMDKVTLYSDCSWMHDMLASAHLFECYILVEVEDYDNCLHHANRAIEVLSGYEGEYRIYLEFLRSRAFHICAYSFYKKEDREQALISFGKQIDTLELIQLQYPENLYNAKRHKAFLQRDNPTDEIPAGLQKLKI